MRGIAGDEPRAIVPEYAAEERCAGRAGLHQMQERYFALQGRKKAGAVRRLSSFR